MIISIAKKDKIPLQIEASEAPPPSDISEVQISGNGVRTVCLSVPVRYPHYPTEVINKNDVDNYIKLLKKVLLAIKPINIEIYEKSTKSQKSTKSKKSRS